MWGIWLCCTGSSTCAGFVLTSNLSILTAKISTYWFDQFSDKKTKTYSTAWQREWVCVCVCVHACVRACMHVCILDRELSRVFANSLLVVQYVSDWLWWLTSFREQLHHLIDVTPVWKMSIAITDMQCVLTVLSYRWVQWCDQWDAVCSGGARHAMRVGPGDLPSASRISCCGGCVWRQWT